jgi:Domain of unknown function (DUF4129)
VTLKRKPKRPSQPPALKRSPSVGYLLAAGVLALLIVAALGAPDGIPVARARPARVVVPDPPAALAYILVAIALLTLVAALVVGLPRHRAQPRRRPGSLSLLALFVVALALWAALPPVQTFTARVLDTLTVEDGRDRAAQPQDVPDVRPPRLRSVVLGYAITLAAAAAAVLLLGVIWWLLRGQGDAPQPDVVEDPVALQIDASLDDLASISDPRAAVLACYARLQRLARDSGVGTSPADAPFELLDRMLSARRVSSPAARRLTVLFEHARFGPRPVDEGMRLRAIQALRDVRKELGAA